MLPERLRPGLSTSCCEPNDRLARPGLSMSAPRLRGLTISAGVCCAYDDTLLMRGREPAAAVVCDLLSPSRLVLPPRIPPGGGTLQNDHQMEKGHTLELIVVTVCCTSNAYCVLVYWCTGVLVYWCTGVLVYCVLVY